MPELFEVIKAANGITPLGLSALLAIIVWMLVKGKRDVAAQVQTLGENHLHDLPLLVENSNRTVEVLQRIEVKLGENFSAIHAKLDDK